jgi:hypothetical protein
VRADLIYQLNEQLATGKPPAHAPEGLAFTGRQITLQRRPAGQKIN